MRSRLLPIESAVYVETSIMLVDEDLLLQAQDFIAGCGRCAPDPLNWLTFDYILDAVTASDERTTEYLMCRSANCPRCSSSIQEKTSVVAR